MISYRQSDLLDLINQPSEVVLDFHWDRVDHKFFLMAFVPEEVKVQVYSILSHADLAPFKLILSTGSFSPENWVGDTFGDFSNVSNISWAGINKMIDTFIESLEGRDFSSKVIEDTIYKLKSGVSRFIVRIQIKSQRNVKTADLLDAIKPTPFLVNLAYKEYKLTFNGITTDEEMTENVLSRWKYLEDLIYSDWQGAERRDDKLYREWTTNSETLAAMTNALMNDLKGKPRILDVHKKFDPTNEYIFEVIVQ